MLPGLGSLNFSLHSHYLYFLQLLAPTTSDTHSLWFRTLSLLNPLYNTLQQLPTADMADWDDEILALTLQLEYLRVHDQLDDFGRVDILRNQIIRNQAAIELENNLTFPNSQLSEASVGDAPTEADVPRGVQRADGVLKKLPLNDQIINERSSADKRCASCMSNFFKDEVVILDCDHDYCHECIVALFVHATKNESTFPPSCCQHGIALAQVIEHLSKEQLGA